MKDLEDISSCLDVSHIIEVDKYERDFLLAYSSFLEDLYQQLMKFGKAKVFIKNPILQKESRGLLKIPRWIFISIVVLCISIAVSFMIPASFWSELNDVSANLIRVGFSAVIFLPIFLFLLIFVGVSTASDWLKAPLAKSKHFDFSRLRIEEVSILKNGCTSNVVVQFLKAYGCLEENTLRVKVIHHSKDEFAEIEKCENILDFKGYEIVVDFIV